MIKWRLMITTLPYVVAALALKIALELGLKFDGYVDFSDVAMVLTGGVFLIGFMLAGTMADFKEAEKLPAELACTFEAAEEIFVQAAEGRQIDLPRYRRVILDTVTAVDDWLHRKKTQAEMYVALEGLGSAMTELETQGAGPHVTRLLRELSILRRTVTRIGVIARTGFLASGYALLEVLTVAILMLMMISRFKNLTAEVTLVGFVTLVYVYMVRLIRDIDDPFEYGGARGAAEVELFPLDEYRVRLQGRVGMTSSSGKAAPPASASA